MKGERIVPYIAAADLIINGIDLGNQKGEKYLVSMKHLVDGLVQTGSVVIDLVGGSKQEPSAIEAIRECTFLDRPFFVECGVFFSALWGWPMMYMMRESSDTYSRQITDLFVGEPDLLIKGFESAALGVQRALVKPTISDQTHQDYGANAHVRSVVNLDSDRR
jgi:alanine dehydrogenase